MLSIVLCFALLLSVMSISSFAEGEEDCEHDYVATTRTDLHGARVYDL